MPTSTTAAPVAAEINGDGIQASIGEARANVFVTAAVFGDPMQQQDGGPGRPRGLPPTAELYQPVAGGSMINS